MRHNDTLVLILTTESYKERHDAIRQTWGQDCNYLFYSDHSDIDTIEVVEKEQKENVVLKIVNLIKKIKDGKVIYNNKNALDYKWILFVDDDTFLNYQFLKLNMIFFNKNITYGIYIILVNIFYMEEQVFFYQ